MKTVLIWQSAGDSDIFPEWLNQPAVLTGKLNRHDFRDCPLFSATAVWETRAKCFMTHVCSLGGLYKMFYDTRLLFGRLVQIVLWHTSAVWETCAKCFVAHYCCLGDLCKLFYGTVLLFGRLMQNVLWHTLPSFQCYCCLGDTCKMFYDTRLLFGRLVQNVLWHTSAVWETRAKCFMTHVCCLGDLCKMCYGHYCCLGGLCEMFCGTLLLFGRHVQNVLWHTNAVWVACVKCFMATKTNICAFWPADR